MFTNTHCTIVGAKNAEYLNHLKLNKKYMTNNISPDFFNNFKKTDNFFIDNIIKFEGTPKAILEFDRIKDSLSDYSYWFVLSTLWVSYAGFSDLNLWKKLFSSNRPLKKTSIMKPDEIKYLENQPYFLNVYRAHRLNENDYIAYTLNLDVAERLAQNRNGTIKKYKIKKKDITALFLRRNEFEVILLDKSKAIEIK